MIKFNDITQQWKAIRNLALPQLDDFLSNNNELILNDVVDEFEKKFAAWNGNKYAIGVSSGTDAIKIALRSLSKSHNKTLVIIQSNTWMSTYNSCLDLFNHKDIEITDCNNYYQMKLCDLEEKLIKKRKNYDNCIVIIAHMYGHCCDIENLNKLKKDFEFKVLEDCSQSHGTIMENNKKTGTFGEASVFSFHPRKNLGSCGDAGAIVTNNHTINYFCRLLRNLGSDRQTKQKNKIIGWNHRLDSIQAIILKEKLNYLEGWNKTKNKIANIYNKKISNKNIALPPQADYCKFNSYYVYPILVNSRDLFVKYMKEKQIETRIQYSETMDELCCFKNLINSYNQNTTNVFRKICSIPLHPFLKEKEIEYIVNTVNDYNLL